MPVPSTNPVSGRYLVLGASPYASASDLWPDMPTPNFLASALLQPVNPNADWTVTTEIAAYQPPVYKSSAGLVLATKLQPFSNGNQMWRIAEYGSAPPVNGQAGGNQIAGFYYPTGMLVNNSPYENVAAYASPVVYLRVAKSGLYYTVSYSSDNTNWTNLYTDGPVKQGFSYVGFSSTDYPVPANEFGPYNMPYFHYFEVTNQTGCP
jgi:hypothetical protein